VNLFKKDPKRLFELVAAITLLLLAFYFVLFFEAAGSKKAPPTVPSTPSPAEEKPADLLQEEQNIDYSQFGAVHVEVDSPSYAKSNFDVNPNTGVTIYFNEPVNVSDAAARFKLINGNTNEKVAVTVASELRSENGQSDVNYWKWQDVWQEKLIFTPTVELEPVTMYKVEIDGGYYNEKGTGTAPGNYRFEFLTAGKPGILSTNLDNRDSKVPFGEQVKVIFKSPMSQEELQTKALLSPDTALDVQVNDKIMIINNPLPKGAYELTIPGSTEDIYGRPLGEDFIFDFSVI